MDNRQNSGNNYNNQYSNRGNNSGGYQQRQNNYGNQGGYQNNYNNGYSGGRQFQQNNNQQQQQQYQGGAQLKNINFDISDIYFPLFVLQLRFDVFPLRNRAQRQNYTGGGGGGQDYNQNGQLHLYEQIEDEEELYQEYQRQFYESNNKIFFILRDRFLLTKIHITGTLVFQIRKDDRLLFGIDDSTGVMTCVLWLNDFNNSGGQSGRRQSDFRAWLTEKNIGHGSVLGVLGGLEYYKDKLQVNVHKLRMITDLSEEMFQYQQTINAQKCFFDPFKPFQRRLFNQSAEQEQAQQVQQPVPDQQQEKPTTVEAQNDVYRYSVKRIKKKINDFILNNYNELFFQTPSVMKQDVDTSEDSPQQNHSIPMQEIPPEYQNKMLTQDDILRNDLILKKVKEELNFCEEQNKDPIELIKECLVELEEKGFLNLVGNTVNKYMVQIREQRQKLKFFISNQLKNTKNGLSFEFIYKAVCHQFDNFYTKEFVFKVIDELFQMGLIYETGKCSYAFLDNQ